MRRSLRIVHVMLKVSEAEHHAVSGAEQHPCKATFHSVLYLN